MSKKDKQEQQAELDRKLSEIDEEMEKKGASKLIGKRGSTEGMEPKVIHCSKCKTVMDEKGRCPNCGHYIYIPMDEKKRKRIQIITTIVGVVVFIVLFVILQFRK